LRPTIRISGNGEAVLLVPKLQLGNAAFEAPASRNTSSWSLKKMGYQAGAWEPANYIP